jgi:hypothetical protein
MKVQNAQVQADVAEIKAANKATNDKLTQILAKLDENKQ